MKTREERALCQQNEAKTMQPDLQHISKYFWVPVHPTSGFLSSLLLNVRKDSTASWALGCDWDASVVKGWSSLVFFFPKVLWLLVSACSNEPSLFLSTPCLSFLHWKGKLRSSGMTGARNKPVCSTNPLITARWGQHTTQEVSQDKHFLSRALLHTLPPTVGTPLHGISLLGNPHPHGV